MSDHDICSSDADHLFLELPFNALFNLSYIAGSPLITSASNSDNSSGSEGDGKAKDGDDSTATKNGNIDEEALRPLKNMFFEAGKFDIDDSFSSVDALFEDGKTGSKQGVFGARKQLMDRMFLSLARQIKASNADREASIASVSSSTASTASAQEINGKAIVKNLMLSSVNKSNLSSQQKGSSAAVAKKKKPDDPLLVFASLAMTMCITLSKGIGAKNPDLCRSLVSSLTDLLTSSGPLALAVSSLSPSSSSSPSSSPSSIVRVLESIRNYGLEMLQSSEFQDFTDLKCACLDLLLALAVSRGSLKDLLSVSDYLYDVRSLVDDECPSSSSDIKSSSILRLTQLDILNQFGGLEESGDISAISIKIMADKAYSSCIASIAATGDNAKSDLDICNSSSIATDGSSIYLWNPVTVGVDVIGSGLHQTYSGQLIESKHSLQTDSKIESFLINKERFKSTTCPYIVPASIICIRDKLYISSPEMVGVDNLIILNATTLDVIAVDNIPLSSFINGNDDTDIENEEEEEQDEEEEEDSAIAASKNNRIKYSFKDTDNIDIRIIKEGYELNVISALYNNVNVAEKFRENQSKSNISVKNVASFLVIDPFPGGSKSLILDIEVREVRKDMTATDQGSNELALSVSTSAAGGGPTTTVKTEILQKNLSSSLSSSLNVKLCSDGRLLGYLIDDKVSDDSVAGKIICINKDIIITSAYYYDSNFVDSIPEAVVTDKIIAEWNKFLVNGENDIKASNDLFGDPLNGTLKTLWINYKVSNASEGSESVFTVSFVEDFLIDWKSIITNSVALLDNDKHVLKFLAVDPESKSVVRYMNLDIPSQTTISKDTIKHTSVVFNSGKLVLYMADSPLRKNVEDASANYNVMKFDFNAASLISQSNETFSKTDVGILNAICFDCRNNSLIALDVSNKIIRRFKNAGIPPRLYFQVDECGSFMSRNPKKRSENILDSIEQLNYNNSDDSDGEDDKNSNENQCGKRIRRGVIGSVSLPMIQAAYLYSICDHWSDSYGPPTKAASDFDSRSLLEIQSQTITKTDKNPGFFGKVIKPGSLSMIVKGRTLLYGDSSDPSKIYDCELGYFVAALDSCYDVKDSNLRFFDIIKDVGAADRMADFIESLDDNQVVMVGTNCPAGHKNLTRRAVAALKLLGAVNVDRIPPNASLAIIGMKGAIPGSVPQSFGTSTSKKVVVRRKLPSYNEPLRVDTSTETIVYILDRAYTMYQKLVCTRSDCENVSSSILLSLIRLLTTNLYQLKIGSASTKALSGEFSINQKEKIKEMTLNILQYCDPADSSSNSSSNNSSTATAILNNRSLSISTFELFVHSFDIIYSSSVDKMDMLRNYSQKFISGVARSSDFMVLEVLVSQLSKWETCYFIISDDIASDSSPSSSKAKSDPKMKLKRIAKSNSSSNSGSGSSGDKRNKNDGVESSVKKLSCFGANTFELLDVLLKMHKTVMQEKIAKLKLSFCHSSSSSSSINSNCISSSTLVENVDLALSTLVKLLFVDICDCFLESDSPLSQPSSSTTTTTTTTTKLISDKAGQAMIKIAVVILESMEGLLSASADLLDLPDADSYKVDRLLEQSGVSFLLTPTLYSISSLLDKRNSIVTSLSDESIASFVRLMSVSYSLVSKIISKLPSERIHANDQECLAVLPQAIKTLESPHPYLPNSDSYTDINFPNAISITVTFSDQSRSENGCDGIRFLDMERNSLHPSIDKFMGRDGGENWPGTGGRPPFVIEGCKCIVHFSSDGSVEDWGYLIKFEATYPPSFGSGSKPIHWLDQISRQMIGCTTSVSKSLISVNSFNESVETFANISYMQSIIKPSMLEPIEEEILNKALPEDVLLSDLIEFPDSDLVNSLNDILNNRSSGWRQSTSSSSSGSSNINSGNSSDQEERNFLIDRAVRATRAALIKTNKLGAEAFALATGAKPHTLASAALKKVWSAGYQIKKFFDVGDLIATVSAPHSSSSSLASGNDSTSPRGSPRSLYSGSDKSTIAVAVEEVIVKAQLLLRYNENNESDSIVDEACSPRSSSSSAKVRWGLVASHGHAIAASNKYHLPATSSSSASGGGSDSIDNSVGVNSTANTSSGRDVTVELSNKWHDLVGVVATSHKMKSIFSQRRLLAERNLRRSKLTIAERTLRFLQSNIQVDSLKELSNIRSARARKRALGLDIISLSLESCFSSATSIVLICDQLQKALRSSKSFPEGFSSKQIHCLNYLEGSSLKDVAKATQSFARVITALVHTVSASLTNFKSEQMNKSNSSSRWKRAIVQSFKCLAMDYEVSDHTYLLSSKLLDVLVEALVVSDRDINTSAAVLMEVLAANAFMKDTSNSSNIGGALSTSNSSSSSSSSSSSILPEEVSEESSLFSRKLAELVVSRLDQIARRVGTVERNNISLPKSSPVIDKKENNIEIGNCSKEVGNGGDNETDYKPDVCILDEESSLISPATSSISIAAPATTLVHDIIEIKRHGLGYSHPHVDIDMTHSLSFWVMRNPGKIIDSKEFNPLAFEIGMIVIRGPDWAEGCMDDGGAGKIGVIQEIIKENDSAVVQWSLTKKKEKYSITPSVLQISIAEPDYGGLIFSKGIASLATTASEEKDNSKSPKDKSENDIKAWGIYGLNILPDGSISVFMSQGSDVCFSYRSSNRLPCNLWTLVTVVQNKIYSSIYINDSLDVVRRLPIGVLRDLSDSNASVKVIESPHPYLDNSDINEVISIAGAESLTITFDPKSRSEKSCDYCKFWKDETKTSFYGDPSEDGKFSGRGDDNNFPGVNGKLPLVIQASKFFFQFVSDSSEHDWGYKIYVKASIPIDSSKEIEINTKINTLPFYFGPPPFYALNGKVFELQNCMDGQICRFDVHSRAISQSEISDIYIRGSNYLATTTSCSSSNFAIENDNNYAIESSPQRLEKPSIISDIQSAYLISSKLLSDADSPCEISILNSLAVLFRGVKNFKSQTLYENDVIGRILCGPGTCSSMFILLQKGKMTVKCAVLRVCRYIFEKMDYDVVNSFAFRSNFLCNFQSHQSSDSYSLIRSILHYIGSINNIWKREEIFADGVSSNTRKKLRDNIILELGLSFEYAQLLRHLVLKSASWRNEFKLTFCTLLNLLPDTLNAFSENNSSRSNSSRDSSSIILNEIMGLLSVIGGGIMSLYVGAKAYYIGNSGMKEKCTILGYTIAPSFDPKNEKYKDEAKLWKGCISYGDAVIIILDSQPDVTKVVPRFYVTITDEYIDPNSSYNAAASSSNINSEASTPGSSNLSPDYSSSSSSSFYAALIDDISIERLTYFFNSLLSIETFDRRPRPRRKVVFKEVVLKFESKHPYSEADVIEDTITIPGASELVVRFDPKSYTDEEDTIQFRVSGSEDAKAHGNDNYSQGKWPGSGFDELIIPNDSVFYRFHVAGRDDHDENSGHWGYKFTVTGTTNTFIEPPKQEVLYNLAVLSSLKCAALKSLRNVLKSCPTFTGASLIPSIISTYTMPLYNHDSSNSQNSLGKSLVFESKHPYDNNTHEFTIVSIPGAKRLKITFDEQCSTENNCDYVRFYKIGDRDTPIEGAEQFCGMSTDSDKNFPGVDGIDDFVVEGDKFEFLFHSDGSVNSWGFKMYVKAVGMKASDVTSNSDDNIDSLSLIGQDPDAILSSVSNLLPIFLDKIKCEPEGADDKKEVFELAPSQDRGKAYVDVLKICDPSERRRRLNNKSNNKSCIIVDESFDANAYFNSNLIDSSIHADSMSHNWPRGVLVGPEWCSSEFFATDQFSVDVHTTPSSTSDVIYSLKQPTEAIALSQHGSWFQITFTETNQELLYSTVSATSASKEVSKEVTGWINNRSNLTIRIENDLIVQRKDVGGICEKDLSIRPYIDTFFFGSLFNPSSSTYPKQMFDSFISDDKTNALPSSSTMNSNPTYASLDSNDGQAIEGPPLSALLSGLEMDIYNKLQLGSAGLAVECLAHVIVNSSNNTSNYDNFSSSSSTTTTTAARGVESSIWSSFENPASIFNVISVVTETVLSHETISLASSSSESNINNKPTAIVSVDKKTLFKNALSKMKSGLLSYLETNQVIMPTSTLHSDTSNYSNKIEAAEDDVNFVSTGLAFSTNVLSFVAKHLSNCRSEEKNVQKEEEKESAVADPFMEHRPPEDFDLDYFKSESFQFSKKIFAKKIRVQSPHPYPPGKSISWNLSIPGANCLLLEFQKSSAICSSDFVSITNLRGENLCEDLPIRPDRHKGFSRANWPGVGGKSALLLHDISSCVVTLHAFSDSDYGLDFNVYGILEDGSFIQDELNAEKNLFENLIDCERRESYLKLSFWILDLLVNYYGSYLASLKDTSFDLNRIFLNYNDGSSLGSGGGSSSFIKNVKLIFSSKMITTLEWILCPEVRIEPKEEDKAGGKENSKEEKASPVMIAYSSTVVMLLTTIITVLSDVSVLRDIFVMDALKQLRERLSSFITSFSGSKEKSGDKVEKERVKAKDKKKDDIVDNSCMNYVMKQKVSLLSMLDDFLNLNSPYEGADKNYGGFAMLSASEEVFRILSDVPSKIAEASDIDDRSSDKLHATGASGSTLTWRAIDSVEINEVKTTSSSVDSYLSSEFSPSMDSILPSSAVLDNNNSNNNRRTSVVIYKSSKFDDVYFRNIKFKKADELTTIELIFYPAAISGSNKPLIISISDGNLYKNGEFVSKYPLKIYDNDVITIGIDWINWNVTLGKNNWLYPSPIGVPITGSLLSYSGSVPITSIYCKAVCRLTNILSNDSVMYYGDTAFVNSKLPFFDEIQSVIPFALLKQAKPIQEALSLATALSRREIPLNILKNKFLPAFRKFNRLVLSSSTSSSPIVAKSSTDNLIDSNQNKVPFSAPSTSRVIVSRQHINIQGAEFITLVVDEIDLKEDQVLRVFDSNGVLQLRKAGIKRQALTCSRSVLDPIGQIVKEAEAARRADYERKRNDKEESGNDIDTFEIGDIVTRNWSNPTLFDSERSNIAPYLDFMDEDGGPGSFGTIVGIADEKGLGLGSKSGKLSSSSSSSSSGFNIEVDWCWNARSHFSDDNTVYESDSVSTKKGKDVNSEHPDSLLQPGSLVDSTSTTSESKDKEEDEFYEAQADASAVDKKNCNKNSNNYLKYRNRTVEGSECSDLSLFMKATAQRLKNAEFDDGFAGRVLMLRGNCFSFDIISEPKLSGDLAKMNKLGKLYIYYGVKSHSAIRLATLMLPELYRSKGFDVETVDLSNNFNPDLFAQSSSKKAPIRGIILYEMKKTNDENDENDNNNDGDDEEKLENSNSNGGGEDDSSDGSIVEETAINEYDNNEEEVDDEEDGSHSSLFGDSDDIHVMNDDGNTGSDNLEDSCANNVKKSAAVVDNIKAFFEWCNDGGSSGMELNSAEGKETANKIGYFSIACIGYIAPKRYLESETNGLAIQRRLENDGFSCNLSSLGLSDTVDKLSPTMLEQNTWMSELIEQSSSSSLSSSSLGPLLEDNVEEDSTKNSVKNSGDDGGDDTSRDMNTNGSSPIASSEIQNEDDKKDDQVNEDGSNILEVSSGEESSREIAVLINEVSVPSLDDINLLAKLESSDIGNEGRQYFVKDSVEANLSSAASEDEIESVKYVMHVQPDYALQSALNHPKAKRLLSSMKQLFGSASTLAGDIEMASHLNRIVNTKNLTIDDMFKLKWSDVTPTAEDTVKLSALKDLMSDSEPIYTPDAIISKFTTDSAVLESRASNIMNEIQLPLDESLSSSSNSSSTSSPKESNLTNKESSSASSSSSSLSFDQHTKAESRFNLILSFNKAMHKAINLIDFRASQVSTIGTPANIICSLRSLIFDVIKNPILEEAFKATEKASSEFELKLSKSRARKFASSGSIDHDARFMVFSQAFRVVHFRPPESLRHGKKQYKTTLLGERAQDAGGPYRESFDIYASELQSPSLPLLIRSQNSQHATGQNRDKFVPNPSATSPTHLEMFSFIGKLMGIAIRSKEYMALNIPSIIWKLLVNDSPTIDDLKGIDSSFVNSLKKLQNIEKDGITEETFGEVFFDTFVVMLTSDGRTDVPLFPGGEAVNLTYSNRQKYCDLNIRYRLHEFNRQVEAIRHGLGTVIPLHVLSLVSWSHLETLVCGSPEIDVQLLQSITEYSGCAATDAHVAYFWQAVNEFSNDERAALIRFCWGRSRLPLKASEFSQRFKLQSFSSSPADSYFPVSHTCFFSLELPQYSSLQVCKAKLLYAIFNCTAIDGDDTTQGLAAAAMGWEE